jgi:hypothetical protein
MEHVMRPDYDFGAEFDYGLTVIINGLARALPDHGGAPPAPPPRTAPSAPQKNGSQ